MLAGAAALAVVLAAIPVIHSAFTHEAQMTLSLTDTSSRSRPKWPAR